MSTILKALREIERQGNGDRQLSSVPPDDAGRRWVWRGIVLAACVIAGAAAALFFAQQPRNDHVSTQRPESPHRPALPSEPASAPDAIAAKPKEEAPWARVMPEARTAAPRATTRPERVAAVPEAAARGAPQQAGEPRIEVRSINFASDAAHRSVNLLIDGRAVTLREGESAGDTQVQLILHDTVYVRWRGTVFAAGPRR